MFTFDFPGGVADRAPLRFHPEEEGEGIDTHRLQEWPLGSGARSRSGTPCARTHPPGRCTPGSWSPIERVAVERGDGDICGEHHLCRPPSASPALIPRLHRALQVARQLLGEAPELLLDHGPPRWRSPLPVRLRLGGRYHHADSARTLRTFRRWASQGGFTNRLGRPAPPPPRPPPPPRSAFECCWWPVQQGSAGCAATVPLHRGGTPGGGQVRDAGSSGWPGEPTDQASGRTPPGWGSGMG